jgi:2-iminoacetate synthase
MSFQDILKDINLSTIQSRIKSATSKDVQTILTKKSLNFNDYLALLSEPASEMLEKLAQRAHYLTLKFFGRTILMYAPLYLCNECDNQCSYCGFSTRLTENGICLSVDQAQKEAEILYNKGFRHILIVSGEKKDKVTISYLKEIISNLHEKFDSISLEIFPLEENEYKELVMAGADGLTIYQEVYNPETYKKFHLTGPKSDYSFRLQTPERAGRAGFYKINIGTLLGLGEWAEEAALLGLHAAYLKKTFWQTQIAISFPRIKGSAVKFAAPYPISDRHLVQMLCALRIFQPTLGLVLSTRESKEFRNNLIPLGITQMSAESETSPGGYSNKQQGPYKNEEQFEVADKRSLKEVTAAIAKSGYEPVLKDWDKAYI